MYLHKITLENIRLFKAFELTFEANEYAGWHVIIGDNGSGKSTLVRAIALALVGPTEALALGLHQNWSEWLRSEESSGKIELQVEHDDTLDQLTGSGARTTQSIPAHLYFHKPSKNSYHTKLFHQNPLNLDLERYIWGEGAGWFSASYGPFRRFTGGDHKKYEKLFQFHPRLAPHLSVFGEDVALTEGLDWLQNLQFKRLEHDVKAQMLDDLKTFLNEAGLLPHGTVLEQVTSDAILFRDGNGYSIAAPQLSDGYRSILSMTFDLIRQMVRRYGEQAVFKHIKQGKMQIDLPGVVLVDEIDTHLYPTWQRQIGLWFCQYFPKLQFIVTTHSPLVCQAAEQGTVWRLPAPGSDFTGGRVEGVEFQRLVYGNILEALDTDLFGADLTRSEASREKLQRLAFLNIKALRSQLTHSEEQERQQLQAMLPTAVNTTESNGEKA